MAFKLKLKRGTAAPSNTALDIGEPGFDTNGKKLYIGNGSGFAASGVSMDGHTHAASDVTSGEFDIARMPTITIGKGGTNITSYTIGDILYASTNEVLSKLPIGSVGTVLSVSAGNVPAWVAQVIDTDTTYVLSTEAGDDAYSEKIRLTAGGSGSGTQDAIIAVGQTDDVYGLAIAESGTTITLTHGNTSTLTGAQGTAGIAAITVDGMGHVTAVTTATYLTAEADTLNSVTGRGATTTNDITVGDIAVNGGNITTNAETFTIGNGATTGDLITNIATSIMTSGSKTVNIGTGSTGATTAINIGANSPDVQTTTTIYGNLVIQGTTTTANAETVNISDNFVILNSDQEGTPTQDAGIEVERGDGTNSTIYWDEANDVWKLFNGEGVTVVNGEPKVPTTVTIPNATGTVALTSQLVTTFLGLSDTPSAYTSSANRLVSVNTGSSGNGTALEFINELDCGTYST